MGLRPRSDDKIELYPIDIGWRHFAADGIRYRDRDLAIVWDEDGRHYAGKVPKGYSVYLDGQRVFTVDRLAHVLYDPTSGHVQIVSDAVNHGPAAQTLDAAPSVLKRPEQVSINADTRLADIVADAGIDVALPVAADNVALAAAVSASYAAPGFAAAAAVDGSTANEPFWGTAGSPNSSDWIELDLHGRRTIDQAVLYFYRSSAPAGEQHGFPSGTRAGYAPPWIYLLQYRDGDVWKDIAGQRRDATIAQGNRNRLRFPAINVDRLRLLVVHAGALRSGLKEVQLYASGAALPPTSGNLAPQVEAWQLDRAGEGVLRLAGRIGDDGLPRARLSVQWRMLSGPPRGEAIFADAGTPDTSVRFTAAGDYVLRLTASDGALQAHADVRVSASELASSQGIPVQAEAQASAEFTAAHHRVQALNDGELPVSGQEGLAADRRWGSWGRQQPSTVWLQYQWRRPQRISASTVYFWDDQPGGGVAEPTAWKLQYQRDADWVDIPAIYPRAGNGAPSRVRFAPVVTTALRAVLSTAVAGAGRKALGVDEWQVFADLPERLEPIDLRSAIGQVPQLPEHIRAWYADGSSTEVAVEWPPLDPARLAGEGRVDLHGLVDGAVPAAATIWVRASEPAQVNTVDALPVVLTRAGQRPHLPEFATVQYNDGSRERRPLRWEPVPSAAYARPGEFAVRGTVEGRGASGVRVLSAQVKVEE